MATTNQFRFGVLAKAPRRAREWRELARRVEGLGYSTLSVPDHMQSQLAPLPALVAAADATVGLRVGTLVANNDFRHPALLACETATVDLLTDGRLELGLGAGWKRRDYSESGIAWKRGARRVDRFEEALEIVRALHRRTPVSFRGRWYELQEMSGCPRPAQDPIPLLIGAGSPRMLALAGRHAQIASISRSMLTAATPEAIARDAAPEAVDEKVAVLRLAAEGRLDPPELHILVTLVALDEPATVARDVAAKTGVTPAEAIAMPQHLIGSVEDVREQLLARRERHGLSYVTISEERLEAFAAVVASLAGA